MECFKLFAADSIHVSKGGFQWAIQHLVYPFCTLSSFSVNKKIPKWQNYHSNTDFIETPFSIAQVHTTKRQKYQYTNTLKWWIKPFEKFW